MDGDRTAESAPDRQRRARWVLAGAAAAFLLAQAAFVAGFQSASLRDPYYGTRLAGLQRRLRAAPPGRRLVLVLGSSRVQKGLVAPALDGPLTRELGRPVVVANFGRAATGPLRSLMTWRRLRRDGVRPDLLVLEILPSFFAGDRPSLDLTPEMLPVTQLDWNDLDVAERYADGAYPRARAEWLRSLPNGLFTQRLALASRLAPGLLPAKWNLNDPGTVAEWPDFGPPPPEYRAQALAVARESYHDVLTHFRLGGRGCDAVRDLLAECRRDGVPTALLLMPEGPEFRSWYGPGAFEALHGWLQRVGAEFGAPLLNDRDWMAEDDFIDSHHLTAEAARRFTARFGAEQLLPLLRATP